MAAPTSLFIRLASKMMISLPGPRNAIALARPPIPPPTMMMRNLGVAMGILAGQDVGCTVQVKMTRMHELLGLHHVHYISTVSWVTSTPLGANYSQACAVRRRPVGKACRISSQWFSATLFRKSGHCGFTSWSTVSCLWVWRQTADGGPWTR